MPVATHVLNHAADRPRHLAVRGPAGSLTYAELAARIKGTRVPRVPLLAISGSDPVEVLVEVLAADLAGVTPLVCDHAQRARITPGATWLDTPGATSLGTPDATSLSTPGATWLGAPGVTPRGASGIIPRGALGATPPRSPLWTPPGTPAGTLGGVLGRGSLSGGGWACFTSGSSGRPRAVVRSRESWTGSFAHLNALTGIGPDDTVLVPGPLNSSLYGFAAVHALGTGATAILPGRWSLADIADATVVHTVPHLLPQVLSSDVRTVLVGGAALDPALWDSRVVSYYGATELSFVAVDVDGRGLRPFPEVEVEVRAGEVWVRSPWVADGYLGDADGPLRRDADGWMTVGDLASYEPGGVLRLRGRGAGAIQTGGATVVAEDVEAVLRRVPGVVDVVVVGSPHPHLGAVVTAIVEGTAPRAALEAAARAELDPAQRPRRWHAAKRLPRTPTGKPTRALAADDYERLP